MVLYLRLLSNDSDDFVMEMAVSGSATFMDLHLFIQEKLGYDPLNMVSFIITDRQWNRKKEISFFKMNDEDENIFLMDQAILNEFIKDKKQRLLYVFDFFSERAFFMEVFKIKKGEQAEPRLLKLEGRIPEQISVEDILDNENDILDDLDGNIDYHDTFDADSLPDDY